MDQDSPSPTIDGAFLGAGFTARAIYERLINAIRSFGPMAEEPQARGVALFAGGEPFTIASPLGDNLLLRIRSDAVIASGRMRRISKDGSGRFRNELLLHSLSDVDEELLDWLSYAYDTVMAGRSV